MSLLTQFLPKKETSRYFLVVSVEDSRICATASVVAGREISVCGSGESPIDSHQEDIDAADKAITQAEKNLPPNTLIEHVVFALPQTYLDGDSVKPDYVERLKQISRELSLKPRGFIDFPSSIAYFLEKEEGSPPTLLLLYVDREQLTFSLIRVGKVQQHIIVKRTDSLSADLAGCLSRFEAEILPSRILMYDSGAKLESLRHELLKFPWHKQSAFLHTPKIEILPQGSITTALVEAAGSSFLTDKLLSGQELTQPPSTESAGPRNRQAGPPDRQAGLPDATSVKEEEPPDKEEISAEEEKQEDDSDAEEKESTLPAGKHPQPEHTLSELPQEAFGFVKGIVDDTAEFIEEALPHYQSDSHAPKHHPHQHPASHPHTQEKPSRMKLPAFKLSLPKFAVPAVIPIMLILVFAAAILGGFYYLTWTFPKAAVALLVYPQKVTKEVDITFVTDPSSSELQGPSILVSELSEDVSGEKSSATTGKNSVGDRAKGELTIYNKTLSSKTFPKGAVLTNGDLRFTLDEEAAVASASDTGEGLSFGKKTAKVSAAAIGSEGNLPAGSTFVFKDFPESSYTAKNTQNLSGGSSREVASVSKEDQTKLEKTLTDELVGQVKQKLRESVSDGQRVIDSSVSTRVSSKNFSADVGSEAKDLQLSMTLSVSALTYRDEDLQKIVDIAGIEVPEGFLFDTQRTSIQILRVDKTKDKYAATVGITAFLLPQLPTEDIAGNIAGKSYDEASNYLATVNYVAGTRFTHIAKLPFGGNTLPRNPKNLILSTEAQ